MKTTLRMLSATGLAILVLAPAGTFAAKGDKGSSSGGGGHTETAGNNLSFPVIWGDGGSIALPGTQLNAELTVEWGSVPIGGTNYTAYAQKTEGNVWQAENVVATGAVYVDEIDWGDSLEAVDMKVGRPVRIELSLYKLANAGLVEPVIAHEMSESMTGYVMVMLDNPSSPDEVQGVISLPDQDPPSAITYESNEATVYSSDGRLVLQQLEGLREDIEPLDLTWREDLSQWVDADPDDDIGVGEPESLTFSGELNVGGKVIYGLSKGGWRPTATGDYRATFYLPIDGDVGFDGFTSIRIDAEEAEATEDDDGGPDIGGASAVVDDINNLTYIDIRVVSGGGGGGGGGKPSSRKK